MTDESYPKTHQEFYLLGYKAIQVSLAVLVTLVNEFSVLFWVNIINPPGPKIVCLKR